MPEQSKRKWTWEQVAEDLMKLNDEQLRDIMHAKKEGLSLLVPKRTRIPTDWGD